jgi:hypothetical protein
VKALSITRPWPALILPAGKDVENRTWPTGYRGPLWIHAAQFWDRHAIGWAEHRGLVLARAVSTDPRDQPTGLVGLVELVDVTVHDRSRWAIGGMWHWSLRHPHLLALAVPCRGRLGLWELPDDAAAAVTAPLDLATRPWGSA